MYRLVRFLLACHCDKTKSSRTAGVSSALVDNSSINHFAMLAEQLLQPRMVHLRRQIAYKDFEWRIRLTASSVHPAAASRRCDFYSQRPAIHHLYRPHESLISEAQSIIFLALANELNYTVRAHKKREIKAHSHTFCMPPMNE
jgi:hypothetical protein